MEHEQNAKGAQKVMLTFFAIFIAGILVSLGVFVVRRMEDVSAVCDSSMMDGVDFEGVCEDRE